MLHRRNHSSEFSIHGAGIWAQWKRDFDGAVGSVDDGPSPGELEAGVNRAIRVDMNPVLSRVEIDDIFAQDTTNKGGKIGRVGRNVSGDGARWVVKIEWTGRAKGNG